MNPLQRNTDERDRPNMGNAYSRRMYRGALVIPPTNPIHRLYFLPVHRSILLPPSLYRLIPHQTYARLHPVSALVALCARRTCLPDPGQDYSKNHNEPMWKKDKTKPIQFTP